MKIEILYLLLAMCLISYIYSIGDKATRRYNLLLDKTRIVEIFSRSVHAFSTKLNLTQCVDSKLHLSRRFEIVTQINIYDNLLEKNFTLKNNFTRNAEKFPRNIFID